MALRIDMAVVRGELDNTEQGRVRGKVWLLGREEPVILDLGGDAWRDVAGMKLGFVNPAPKAQESSDWLKPMQKGAVGDITASRKVRVFTVEDEEWLEAYQKGRIDEVPTEWRNSLYLEWFSTEQGRCVIESADFEITISGEPMWQMDEDEEGAQRLANMQAMRDYLDAMIQREEPTAAKNADEDEVEAMTEEAWENQLKASDRLTDASMEALDKYGEEEDAKEKMAFVMGWDHLLGDQADGEGDVAFSDDDDGEGKRRREWLEMMSEACDEADAFSTELDEGADDSDDDDESMHPLRKFSHDLVLRFMQQLQEAGLDDVRGDSRGHPLDRLISHVMQISGKLGGALSAHDNATGQDTGYTLAITKRCLNWANEALAALEDLGKMEEFTVHAALVEQWRGDLFKLREGITDLRREIREG